MDLDDILSVQTPHFQFLTRPAALSTRRSAAHQSLSQESDVSMIIQSITVDQLGSENTDGLDNHAHVNFLAQWLVSSGSTGGKGSGSEIAAGPVKNRKGGV